MDKNVTIPLSLINSIIDLLGCWNILSYDESVQQDYEDVLSALFKKLQRIELRDAYAKILNAKTEFDRHSARMEYLEKRRMLNEPF
jgi:hypothetical protein